MTRKLLRRFPNLRWGKWRMAEAHVLPTAQGSVADVTRTSKPTCIICLGMAGSGKTTFVQVRHLLYFSRKAFDWLSTSLILLLHRTGQTVLVKCCVYIAIYVKLLRKTSLQGVEMCIKTKLSEKSLCFTVHRFSW